MRISWDSTVCIDFLDREPSQFEFLRPIVEDAIAKRLIIVVSSLAISETIHLKSVADLLEQQRLIQSFFDASYVHVHAYERFIAERARDLRRSYKIDSADAGHVATAAFADCHVFLTDDGNAQKTTRNLLRYDGLIDVGGEGDRRKLRIMTPEQYHNENVRKQNPVVFAEIDHKRTTGPEIQTEASEAPQLPPPSDQGQT